MTKKPGVNAGSPPEGPAANLPHYSHFPRTRLRAA